jgi:hypothetical protein
MSQHRPTIMQQAIDAAASVRVVLVDPEHRLVRLAALPTLPSHGASPGV